jgi:AcrR family transcriptional regulator
LIASSAASRRPLIMSRLVAVTASTSSVHRTTVYRYFGSRDDVLAFVILRESAGVIEGAQQTMEGSRPFSKRLLDALDGAIAAVEKSRWLRVLFSPKVSP